MNNCVNSDIKWQLEDYANFKKCGEIIISSCTDSRIELGLNCRFCSIICLKYDTFIQHLKDDHIDDIINLYTLTKENCTKATQTDCIDDKTLFSNFCCGGDNEIYNAIDWNEFTSMINDDGTMIFPMETNLTMDIKEMSQEGPFSDVQPNQTICEKDFELEMELKAITADPSADAPQEEVGLVYIVEENALQGDIQMEEETVDSFEIFHGGCSYSSSNSNTSGLGVSCDSFEERVGELEDEQLKDGNENLTEKRNDVNIDNEDSEITVAHSTRSSKYKYLKTEKNSSSEHNREIMTYLIEAYRSTEKLWNPNHVEYKYNAGREMYNELSKPLLNDMNCAMTGTEIFRIITELKSRYRRELTKLKQRQGRNYKTKLWYFDKMEFLKNIIEDKRAIRQAKNLEHDAIEEKKMEKKEILKQLLELYKCREFLWNPNHEDYMDCNKDKQFDDIALCLKEDYNILLNGTECYNEIKHLRTRYRKDLTCLLKSKGLYIPKLWCFDEMHFLRKIFENEKLRNKITDYNHVTRSRLKYLKSSSIVLKNTDELLKFIEIYKNYKSLWDVEHSDYRSSSYRNESIINMLDDVNRTFQYKYQIEHLEKTIYEIRKNYSREKEKLLTNRKCDNSDRFDPVIYEKLNEFLGANVGPFRCELCDVIIKTSDQYKMHQSGHNGNKPFICTICGKGFDISGNLTIHIRRHKRDFPYSCKKCNKSFPTTSELTIHIRSHTGERPYICDLCGKSFKTWSFFDIHRRTHLNQSPFLCPICDKGFYERNRYTDHMNIHLNIRKHSCQECNKSFTTIANLRKHQELHSPIKKYKCDDCSKCFSQFASLRWHRRSVHKDYIKINKLSKSHCTLNTNINAVNEEPNAELLA